MKKGMWLCDVHKTTGFRENRANWCALTEYLSLLDPPPPPAKRAAWEQFMQFDTCPCNSAECKVRELRRQRTNPPIVTMAKTFIGNWGSYRLMDNVPGLNIGRARPLSTHAVLYCQGQVLTASNGSPFELAPEVEEAGVFDSKKKSDKRTILATRTGFSEMTRANATIVTMVGQFNLAEGTFPAFVQGCVIHRGNVVMLPCSAFFALEILDVDPPLGVG